MISSLKISRLVRIFHKIEETFSIHLCCNLSLVRMQVFMRKIRHSTLLIFRRVPVHTKCVTSYIKTSYFGTLGFRGRYISNNLSFVRIIERE
jgi:hypothetical protein